MRYFETKQAVLAELRKRLDLSRVGEGERELLRSELRLLTLRVCEMVQPTLNATTKDFLVQEVLDEILERWT
jgi:hypothetical protein